MHPVGVGDQRHDPGQHGFRIPGEQLTKTGRFIDASDEQEYDDVLARERALISGHADMRYTGLITLTATSLPGLRAAVATTQRAATSCMLETRILYGRQAQGFTAAALPLGRAVA